MDTTTILKLKRNGEHRIQRILSYTRHSFPKGTLLKLKWAEKP